MGGDALQNSPNISCNVLKIAMNYIRSFNGKRRVHSGLLNVSIKSTWKYTTSIIYIGSASEIMRLAMIRLNEKLHD